ncbi:Mur ligase family protein [Alkalicoccus daliensis]|uniref:UDP-N-acetylmuramoyl-tripeptide--D-alanyl-D-alanine ligase n=1 Tax=Alkalicoccus daliensis TaxID=745820 RepID=A0A1H0GWA6_9BACI|nr:UDP-N-acetylmuramoyl-tripeptide--D-alanyl-D-alanine ligase [Alkalicoccus daliensis]SDO11104.1 UDP-N-acetylmuramoyl-tripeptide--D-alanyl-D-alanine ligase [Alkalicoccus daliensis]
MISTIVFFIVLLAAWILPVTLKVKRSVHMLQLNFYQNEELNKWMSNNMNKVFSPIEVLYFTPIILVIFSDADNFILAGSAAAFIIVFGYLYATRPEKEGDLEYTPQIQRIFGVTYLLYGVGSALAIAIGAFISIEFSVVVLIVLACLPFTLVKITNSLLEPVERNINQRSIDDAKRLIQASPDLKVIGVTGSAGKSSVKTFAEAILSEKYNVLVTSGSYHTELSVTETINEQLKPDHEVFIVEMNAKQEGDIASICGVVGQEYGIISSISEEHMETFGSLETIKKTKHEIVETLPENGTALLNKDDENIRSYEAANPVKSVYYGIEQEDVDIRASEIAYSRKGTSFKVVTADGETENFQTCLLGKHNIYNLLAAIALGLEMNMTLSQMILPIKNIAPLKRSLELKPQKGNITIIDDSNNSDPAGSKRAVEILGKMNGYRMLITPGIMNLEESEYEWNKEWSRYSAEKCDYIILVGEKLTKYFQEGLEEVKFPKDNYYVAEDFNDAIQHMHKIAKPETIALFDNNYPEAAGDHSQ